MHRTGYIPSSDRLRSRYNSSCSPYNRAVSSQSQSGRAPTRPSGPLQIRFSPTCIDPQHQHPDPNSMRAYAYARPCRIPLHRLRHSTPRCGYAPGIRRMPPHRTGPPRALFPLRALPRQNPPQRVLPLQVHPRPDQRPRSAPQQVPRSVPRRFPPSVPAPPQAPLQVRDSPPQAPLQARDSPPQVPLRAWDSPPQVPLRVRVPAR